MNAVASGLSGFINMVVVLAAKVVPGAQFCSSESEREICDSKKTPVKSISYICRPQKMGIGPNLDLK
jgi:hypothetical protein